MEIKIDKNVPMPNARGKYPLDKMEIGDSFFVAEMTSSSMSGTFPRLRPKTFTTRTATENGVKGLRVWRAS